MEEFFVLIILMMPARRSFATKSNLELEMQESIDKAVSCQNRDFMRKPVLAMTPGRFAQMTALLKKNAETPPCGFQRSTAPFDLEDAQTWKFCAIGQCEQGHCDCFSSYVGEQCAEYSTKCWLMYCFLTTCRLAHQSIYCRCDPALYGKEVISGDYWYADGRSSVYQPPPTTWRDDSFVSAKLVSVHPVPVDGSDWESFKELGSHHQPLLPAAWREDLFESQAPEKSTGIRPVSSKTYGRTRISDAPSISIGRIRISDAPSISLGRTRISDAPSISLERTRISNVPSISLGRTRISDVPSVSLGRTRISDAPSASLGRTRISDAPLQSSSGSGQSLHQVSGVQDQTVLGLRRQQGGVMSLKVNQKITDKPQEIKNPFQSKSNINEQKDSSKMEKSDLLEEVAQEVEDPTTANIDDILYELSKGNNNVKLSVLLIVIQALYIVHIILNS